MSGREESGGRQWGYFIERDALARLYFKVISLPIHRCLYAEHLCNQFVMIHQESLQHVTLSDKPQ